MPVNGNIAPKSIVIGVADPIPQRGRRNCSPRQRESRPHGEAVSGGWIALGQHGLHTTGDTAFYSMRRDQSTMETKLEQIAATAVKQRPKSVVREIRTPRSVGTGGGRPPPVTRWAPSNGCPYRNREIGAGAPLSKRHW